MGISKRDIAMLELARCRECGEVKLCIPFRGVKGEERIPFVNHYCPECDEAIDEFIDRELERYRARCRVFLARGSKKACEMKEASSRDIAVGSLCPERGTGGAGAAAAEGDY